MTTPFVALAAAAVSAALTTVALTPVVRAWARARGVLDNALALRASTGRPVPRLGGLAVLAAFAVGVAVAWSLLDPSVVGRTGARVGPVLLAAFAIGALGAYDDLRGAGAEKKLAVQLGLALVLFAAGFRADHLEVPGLGSVDLGVLALPVTVLWIVGLANAVNLIDGLDGLASGLAVVAALALATLAAERGDTVGAALALALAGAALGFLPWNRAPATIFLGDTGSLVLGTTLAVLALLPPVAPTASGHDGPDLVAPAVALALPIADTTWAVVRRLRGRRRLFMGDRAHIHHRLAERLGVRLAVWTLWAIALGLGAMAVRLGRG